jgi:lysophospholipase L1-like esterase
MGGDYHPMSRKRIVTAFLISIACLLLLASLARTPLKRAWYSYLNDYASEYYVEQTMAFNARKDLNMPANAVLFYGDSMVQGLVVQNAYNTAVNYGIGHATSQDVARQLREHRNTGEAAAIVIAVGINDIARGNANQVLPAYEEFLKSIPNRAPVIISKIMPVNETDLGLSGLSEKVGLVNLGLEEICATNQRVQCLDAGQLLVDADGNLARQFHTGDGLHLNRLGNAIWLEQLQLAIKEVTGDIKEGKRDISDDQSL